MPFKNPHVNVGITESVHHQLVLHAATLGMTISDLADDAITRGLAAIRAQPQTQKTLGEASDQLRPIKDQRSTTE